MRGILQRIGNAGQDICSISSLAVYFFFLGDDRAGIQIDQLHHDGRGAIVHRQTIMPLPPVTGFHSGNDPIGFTVDKRYGNIIAAVPAHGIELTQNRKRNRNILIAVFTQCQPDPLLIADRHFLRGHLKFQKYFFAESLHVRFLRLSLDFNPGFFHLWRS